MAKSVFVVLHNYSDGSPYTDTSIDGVYASYELAEKAALKEAGMNEPGLEGGSWREVQEWIVQEEGDG